MATYDVENHRIYKVNDEGERILLSNFIARIVQETRTVDGPSVQTTLTIEGEMPSDNPDRPTTLPPVEIDASEFNSMSWVLRAWGVKAIIHPGGSVKDDLRAAIQLASKPKQVTIYRSTGWQEIGRRRIYLHAGGAIGSNGNTKAIQVRLSPELRRYDLTTEEDPKAGFRASLALTKLGPYTVAWPLFAATYAPIFGDVDFATHLTGRSGTFKSELISLFQSHYGKEMDARHLPGSWSSTANALEAQAYYAKNAPFVVDDFVPTGTSWQVKSYQTIADKLIRAQGNQAGRARMTDTASLQAAYYPRGIVLSTGEDTPEGHSVRARMLIMELSPGDVEPAKLTVAQKNRHLYSAAVAELIKDLADDGQEAEEFVKTRSEELRDELIDVGHSRTPPMLGRLIATAEAVLEWALAKKYITATEATEEMANAKFAITEAGKQQQSYLESADPVDIFRNALRQVLSTPIAHVRTLSGGIPRNPTVLGYTEERSAGELPRYKSHGPCIGWIDWDDDMLYLEINQGYAVIKKVAGAELGLTKQTLFKRLKDAGLLARTDDSRQRNTIRITADQHPRQVLAMAVSEALEITEVPGDDDEENDDA